MKDIPIIKTFIVNNKCFFYDTFSNRIYRVSKEHYRALLLLENIGITDFLSRKHTDSAARDICDMIGRGHIKGRFVEKIEHSQTADIPNLLESCISYLLLQVTKSCNYRCRYCVFANETTVERHHSHDNMSWSIAKSGIDFLYQHSRDANQIALAFYGGEPLLNFEIIKRSVLYIESLFHTKNISYFLTTNASLLNDHIIDFFIEHNFLITISLDGPTDIQNKHRLPIDKKTDAYQCVIDAITAIRAKNADYFRENVSFNSVLFPDENRSDIEHFFQSELKISKNNYEIDYADLRGIDYLPQSDYPESIANPDHRDMLSKKEDERIRNLLEDHGFIYSHFHPNGPCIPGIVRLFLSTEGVFYPCEKAPEKSCVSIGSLEEGLNVDRITQFANICQMTEAQCSTCWAMRLCSMCVLKTVDYEKNCISVTEKMRYCQNTKKSILESLKKEVMKHDFS